ncbi:hypothetical protein [Leptospira mayottensis]|uniref:hypothetical protein n=1 Tax=Leptospira mayottensis TaxID=1137606 RepID=UPI0013C2CAC5|nr:hypothetical protein [Leptospira mayottensis]
MGHKFAAEYNAAVVPASRISSIPMLKALTFRPLLRSLPLGVPNHFARMLSKNFSVQRIESAPERFV